ncbi:T9SS type B sorting domain-containing protein [Flavobacterium sp. ABG]|uniref:T9SS type B sorting domain-containing protein n=1 Tax=Flavobacterium sp. ABG TaxID=1423322 RepID=UPI00069B5EBE|nr:choice-of-anchor L domain-containing protein [Flavobacterium sp. ABG]
MKKILFILLLMLTPSITKAQLLIDNTTFTPQQLAENVLLGQGINISNIKFNGSVINSNTISDQIAKFDSGITTSIGLNKGIVLSTGNAVIAKGPNDRDLATLPTSNPFEGDGDLSVLTNNQIIKNVAVLEFDFVPVGNRLSFNFVFASEEYPEYVNDIYNDNFAFFISGPGINGAFSRNAKNIALIPNSTIPVSINNLNNGNGNKGPCEFCQYYTDNKNGDSIQYDGFTTVLKALSPVQCGETYHIKLIIGNVGDNNYDSAVFIEGASFSSDGIDLGEDLKICSSTEYTLNTGLDSSVLHEWKLDGSVISSQNGPSITVNKSGVYSVKTTPMGIGCPVSDDIKIEFGTLLEPDLYCGRKTANSITFDWHALGDAGFSVAYKIGNNSLVDVGFLGKVFTYTVQNVPNGETVKITVTPSGTPRECFSPSSISCKLDICLTNPTLVLTQGISSQALCYEEPISDVAYTIGGGATNALITSGSLPPGVITSLVGNVLTISGTPTSSGTFNYTISTSGGCGLDATTTGSITVNAKIVPVFSTIAPICEGEIIIPLPLQSKDGINGTWSPVLNSLRTTEYTFTPNVGECANIVKLIIIVNSKAIPVFNPVSAVCEGEIIAKLPLRSNNGVNGTWSPVLNNLVTTEYTFTPNIGECASATKLTIVVNSKIAPLFNAIPSVCEGEIIAELPLRSNNGINGTWSPVLNNVTSTVYTFTPDSGECATTAKLAITVNSKIIPVFNPVAAICEGDPMILLPSQSNNGINGAWSPILNNLVTTVYTFTPNSGQCSSTAKLTIEVDLKPQPKLKDGQICIEKGTNNLIQSHILDTTLSNQLYDFEWFLDGNKINDHQNNSLEVTRAGSYAVIAINKKTLCVSDLAEAIVTDTKTDSGTIEIIQSELFSENSTITVKMSNVNNSGEYEYRLDNKGYQNSNVFTDVSPGTHTLHIVDTKGCTNITKEIVIVGYKRFFTPNGDGHNDTWNIIGFENIQNARVYVFDRFGKLIKEMSANESGWNGTYNGIPLPSTDYWFKVIFMENQVEKEFRSHFSLKR